MSAEVAVIPATSREMEYKPFGSDESIKLSIQIVKNLVAVKTRNGETCGDNDAIKFMMMCKSRKLNPFEGDAFLIGFDSKDGPKFNLITAHQAFLKRAEVHPEYDGMQSGVVVRTKDDALVEMEGDFFDQRAGQVVVGAWARVHFKNRKLPMFKKVRLEAFQQPYGRWAVDAAGMIVKCAEADALRSSFPTMLGGMYLREEVDLIDVKVVPQAEVTSAPPAPRQLRSSKNDPKPSAVVDLAQQEPAPTPDDTNPEPTAPEGTGPVNPPPAAAKQEASTSPASPAAPKTPSTSSKTATGGATTVAIQVKTPADWLPNLDPTDPAAVLTSLKEWMGFEVVSEPEVIGWCVKRNLAKTGQKVSELSTAKLLGLIKQRDKVLADIVSWRPAPAA